MEKISLSLLAFANIWPYTSAYVYVGAGGLVLGSGSPVSQGQNASIYNRFVEANTHPNDTRSVKFAPFNLGGVGSGSTAPDESNLWTWRVNVTSVSVPDAEPEFPSEQPGFEDPRIENTVFDFSWPQGGNLSDAFNGTDAIMCATILTAPLLANATNLYTDDDADSADCTPVLGEDCVQALNGALNIGSGSCQSPRPSLDSIPECASSLGTVVHSSTYLTSFVNVLINPATANGTSPNNSSTASQMRGGPINDRSLPGTAFFSQSSQVYNGTNTTLYDQAAERFQFMFLSVSPGSIGGLVVTRPLCMRVKTTELPTNTSDGDATPTGDTSSDTSTPDAAMAIGVNTFGLGAGFGGLAALFALL